MADRPPKPADSCPQSDAMVAALTRLKEKINRLELNREAADSDLRKLAEETSLFREQLRGFDREWRCGGEEPAARQLSASQASLGPRDFDAADTEDEFFVLPEVTVVAEVTPQDAREVSNTLDIVENRCFALEREFRLMREVLEEADRKSVARTDLLQQQRPKRKREPDRKRLDSQLQALLGPSAPPPPRDPPAAARPARKATRAVSFEEVLGNVRPRRAKAAPSAVEAEKRKVRAILSDLHLELEGLKAEHSALANRLAAESNRAQKAVLVRDLDRVVRCMEQKGEQVGRLKSYMRCKSAANRLVVRDKPAHVTAPKERQLLRASARKVNPTLSEGDVRWTNAP